MNFTLAGEILIKLVISYWAWETQGVSFSIFFWIDKFYEVIQILWNFLEQVPRRLSVKVFPVRI